MNPGVTFFVLASMMTLGVCNGQATFPDPKLCRTMNPVFDNFPQMTLASYGFNLSDSCFKTGHSLLVSLAGMNGSAFIGFFVEARKPNDDTFSYGTFNSHGDPNIVAIDCFNQSASAIGHLNLTGYNVTITTFQWTPPTDVSIDVLQFMATVNVDERTWGMGLETEIKRCNDNTSPEFTDATTTTTTITTETSPPTTTDGTGYTLSTAAATLTSNNESHTVAITTASMTNHTTSNHTTSGAGRPKDSMMSFAFSVAFVASLASVQLLV